MILCYAEKSPTNNSFIASLTAVRHLTSHQVFFFITMITLH